MRKLLSSVVNTMQVPSMRLCVCNMCEFAIGINVCRVLYVSCNYLCVHLLELAHCVLPECFAELDWFFLL
jgi:hypothetical protein